MYCEGKTELVVKIYFLTWNLHTCILTLFWKAADFSVRNAAKIFEVLGLDNKAQCFPQNWNNPN